jgi:hypothetical protein
MTLTRREWISKVGWGAMVAAAGAFAMALVRFLEPNVTSPAPGPVEIGSPSGSGCAGLVCDIRRLHASRLHAAVAWE